MFSQSISMNANHNDNGNEKTRFISSDYSPFVTDDNYIIDSSMSIDYIENDNIEDINTETIVDFNDDIDDGIVEEENAVSDDYVSNSILILTKKKKNIGIKYRKKKKYKKIKRN